MDNFIDELNEQQGRQ
ncbi:hypothetical protein CCU_00430 [Coprococcus sp. ART55/1]|nr:hypothetical protein CCU_00430 [Coprococcus sp. ART55/1]